MLFAEHPPGQLRILVVGGRTCRRQVSGSICPHVLMVKSYQPTATDLRILTAREKGRVVQRRAETGTQLISPSHPSRKTSTKEKLAASPFGSHVMRPLAA